MIASTIANVSGKTLKHPVPLEKFLPSYVDAPEKKITDPKQRAEYRMFKEKLGQFNAA